jgi:hypothetical protein
LSEANQNVPVSPAAAFADPARGPRVYVHATCGKQTRMPEEVVQKFLADPHRFNDWAFCSGCDTYVRQRECRWVDGNETVADYLGRIRASVPPPPSAPWVPYAGAAALVLIGGAVGALFGGWGLGVGLLVGVVLGASLLIVRRAGLR